METITDDKSCRTCTDFKTWAKLQKKKFESQQNSNKNKQNVDNVTNIQTTANMQKSCPLDKDELGSSSWNLLHTIAAYYPKVPTVEQKKEMKTFFHLFSKIYPCAICAKDLQEQLKNSPPQTNSQKELSQWLCDIHNEINRKLGKSEFNCSLINERWRDGWADGSCD